MPNDNTDFADFLDDGPIVPSQSGDTPKDKSKTATKVSFEIDTYMGDAITRENGPGLEEDYIKSFADEELDLEIETDTEADISAPVVEEKPTAPVAPAPKQPVIEEDSTFFTPEEDEAKKKKGRSAQARIRELSGREKEALKRAEEAERRLNETNATFAKLELRRLQDAIQNLEATYQKAIEDGDSAAIVNAQKEMFKTMGELSEMERTATHYEQLVAQPAPTNSTETSGLTPAAEEWAAGKEFLFDKEAYGKLTAPQRKKVALLKPRLKAIAQELINEEGFKNDDPLFYEALDARLTAEFPFYAELALTETDDVELDTQADNTASQSGATLKPQSRPVQEKSKQVPVKGPSAAATSTTSATSSNKKSVTLTKGDVAYWKNYLEPNGITLKEYAKLMWEDQQQQGKKF